MAVAVGVRDGVAVMVALGVAVGVRVGVGVTVGVAVAGWVAVAVGVVVGIPYMIAANGTRRITNGLSFTAQSGPAGAPP